MVILLASKNFHSSLIAITLSTGWKIRPALHRCALGWKFNIDHSMFTATTAFYQSLSVDFASSDLQSVVPGLAYGITTYDSLSFSLLLQPLLYTALDCCRPWESHTPPVKSLLQRAPPLTMTPLKPLLRMSLNKLCNQRPGRFESNLYCLVCITVGFSLPRP